MIVGKTFFLSSLFAGIPSTSKFKNLSVDHVEFFQVVPTRMDRFVNIVYKHCDWLNLFFKATCRMQKRILAAHKITVSST